MTFSSHAPFDEHGWGMLIRDVEYLTLYVTGSNDVRQDAPQSVAQSNAEPLAVAPPQLTGFDGMGGSGNLGQPASQQATQAAQTPVTYPITAPLGGTGVVSPAAHGVLIAEGAAAMTTAAPGTAGRVLASNGASADPTFQAVTALVADATTSTKGVVELAGDLAGSGTTAAAPLITANAVTNAKLAQATALTVLGNATNATATRTDIAASADGQMFRRVGTALGFSNTWNYSTASTTNTASTANFTVPGGIYQLLVLVKGAGGGGGGAAIMSGTSLYAGSGGGEGGLSMGGMSVIPGQLVSVTVGAGGAGGVGASQGTAGGDSTVGSYIGRGGNGGRNGAASGNFFALSLAGDGGGFTIAGMTGQSGNFPILSFITAGNLTMLGGRGGGSNQAVGLGPNGSGGDGATGSAGAAQNGTAGKDGYVTILY